MTNTGETPLENVVVTDDREGPVSCPKSSLEPGEAMTCSLSGFAQSLPCSDTYENVARVTASAIGGTCSGVQEVSDSDRSAYHTERAENPAIDIEKATNGHDADAATGPKIPVGDPVTWTYVVTNTGDTELHDVIVTDDKLGTVCEIASLAPGQSETCTAHGTAVEGQYRNEGWARATSTCGQEVEDHDPSHYFGEREEQLQGCTPGYWKNHTDSWPPTGYSTAQSVASVFAQAAAYPAHGSATLLEALSFQGGSTIEGAVGNLLRAAVAGLLDASHPGVDYPRSPAALIADTDAALASGDRDTMLALAGAIDRDNNLGCPLN